ncbi:hypothetical protein E2C01_063958 [Portunus trituberculatus]|uniref:Uncharacterized protein n=1 Tax=Portunus trituberculatus TaxID=210409 RepID=A0A5B7HKG0_PORTR|nr:hypothetical protein [Portunus trituberculatus]
MGKAFVPDGHCSTVSGHTLKAQLAGCTLKEHERPRRTEYRSVSGRETPTERLAPSYELRILERKWRTCSSFP